MSKPVVLIAEQLSPATIDALGPDFDVRHVDGTDRPALLAALAESHAVLVRSATKIDAEALSAAPNLKVVARAGVGMQVGSAIFGRHHAVDGDVISLTVGVEANAVGAVAIVGDGGALCHALFGVHDDEKHGARCLRFRCGPRRGVRFAHHAYKVYDS